MASPTVSSGKDQDLTFDDVKLDDLTLDDDALFADLDNEVRLEGVAGDDSLSLDLKDEDFKLDFDVEAVGEPAEAAGAKATPGRSAPAPAQPASGKSSPSKAAAGKSAAPAEDLDLDNAKLGSLDDLDLDIPEAVPGSSEATDLGDLDLDMTSDTGKGAGGDLDLDLTGVGGGGQAGGDMFDVNLDSDPAGAGEQGTGASAVGDLDLTLDMGATEEKSVPAAAAALGAGRKDSIELDLGSEHVSLEEEATGAGTGAPSAETTEGEIDLGFDTTRPQEPSHPKGAEQLEEIELSEEGSGGGAEAVLDTEELPAADSSIEEAPQEFQAAPDVDLDAVDLNLDMPIAKSRGDEQAPMGPSEAAAAATAMPAALGAGRLFSGMGTGRFEDVVELNLSDLESQPMGSVEQPMPGAMAQRGRPPGAAAERAPAARPKGEAGMTAATSALAGSVLLSIPHQVQVRMGSVSLQGQDILNLDYGSVVPLNRSVGEPVELTLNGKTIAQGEIVVINGRNLGVRIVALGG